MLGCTLCLKPERQYDPHYRYKMPPLEVVVDSRNRQRKTHLPNVASVAKNVFRPEKWLVKYLALRNSTDSGCSTSSTDAYLTGHHSSEDLQQLVFSFIRDYVLCKCGSPETWLHVEGKKKSKVGRLQCHSCGRSGRAAGQDEKLLNFFATQPMPPELCPMGHLGDAAHAVATAAGASVDRTEATEVGGKHVTWDEATIAEHRACAGVLYGTQRIQESLTPFLYYSESVSRAEGAMGEFVPGAGISKVSIEALQERLGVLAFAQSAGDEIRPSAVAHSGRPLPPAPWLLLQSRAHNDEFFYFNPTTREATWSFPVPVAADEGTEAKDERSTTAGASRVAEAMAPTPEGSLGGTAHGVGSRELDLGSGSHGDDVRGGASSDDEEVPLPTSKLATAADCAADFAHRRRAASAAASR